MINPLRSILPALLLVVAALPAIGRAQMVTSWNAYNDFYLSPTAGSWGGATSPSAAGQAWGYYMGNVNGSGFPVNVGSYLTSGQIYKYTSFNPAGASDGTVYGTTLWDNTGGAGFARYQDTLSWGTSLGSYTTPWFGGAPGNSQGLTNLIWLQSGWLSGPSSEGIASVLTWTAPAAGTYSFSGLFVSGDQPANSAAVAIVSSGGADLARTVMVNNSVQNFSFTNTYNLGDTVQFQVGNNFSTGSAVGLQLEVVPEPSTVSLAVFGLAAAALYGFRRKYLL